MTPLPIATQGRSGRAANAARMMLSAAAALMPTVVFMALAVGDAALTVVAARLGQAPFATLLAAKAILFGYIAVADFQAWFTRPRRGAKEPTP